jgi:hypothetical protein
MQWYLRNPLVRSRQRDAQQFIKGRRDVYDVVVLRADLSAISDAARPVDDKRRSNAAAMVAALTPFERRVGDLRPSGGVVVECPFAADSVDAG